MSAAAPFTKPMLPPDSLKDRVIVVTGGGTGLGRAMGTYFLQLGAKVVIASRKQAVLDQTASEMMAETGGEVLAVACDVRDYTQVETLLQRTLDRFGRVDVLLNNAAGNFISPTERLSNRAFDTVVDIVLKGSTNCTLAFGKHWIAAKQPATVLSIVTTYSWMGSAFVVPSACAKAGVLALTRSLAVEWAKYGIRFNAIAPGPFPTEGAWSRLFPVHLMPKEIQEKLDMTKMVPVGRVGEHPELANLAAYLVSDFSAYINGEVVTIDGGEWLQNGGEFNWARMIPNEMWDALEQATRAGKSS